ncbi:MAG: hypothetical protein ACTTKU_07135 [Eggerthia catenaformis]|uniref:hypothetical protein n=1 Tax=Eggerthia catenaformis TaxID=31973 RepID=UPI000479EC25|nr:hypothetical protein [Eggerthia catenaformis]
MITWILSVLSILILVFSIKFHFKKSMWLSLFGINALLLIVTFFVYSKAPGTGASAAPVQAYGLKAIWIPLLFFIISLIIIFFVQMSRKK